MLKKKYMCDDFCIGSMVKSPFADAGDRGLIPGPGIFHTPGATKPVHHNYRACALELVFHSKRSHCNEKPVHHN